MEPNEIPIIGSAAGGVDGPPRPLSQLAAVRDLAAAAEARVAAITGELADATRDAAADAERVSDESLGTVYVDIQGRAVDAAKKVQRGADLIYREARDRAADAEARTHAAVAALGGAPLVMTDEAYGVNQAGSHAAEALERIILPAIAGQSAGEIDERPVTPPLGVPDLPADLIQPPREPGPPQPGEPWVPFPIPGLPEKPVPGPGEPPPDEPAEPPPPDPYAPPPAGGECCPPQQIIVQPPPVYITLPPLGVPGVYPPPGVPMPVTPPVTPPATPPVTPPVEPPATPPVTPPPVAPPVLPPVAPSIDAPDGIGPQDGPGLCAGVQVAAGILASGEQTGVQQSARLLVTNAIGGLDGIPVIGPVIAGVMKGVLGSIWAVDSTLKQAVAGSGVQAPAAAVSDISYRTVTGFLERWTGSPLGYYLQPQEQAARYANPLNILGQSDADATYLMGGLTRETWECLTRMNGNLPWQHFQSMYSKRARTNDAEIVELRMRGSISDAEYMTLMRERGYLEPVEAARKLQLREYVPSTPDLFRWIAKDVWDDGFAERFGLDEDFPDPLPAAFQRWFGANGTSAAQIKYDYRSQWRLPSTTQLGEMVARLRPGRVPANVQVTAEDANRLLKLDEWPARIREQILATLTVPVNRTDLIEGYKAGTVDDAELVERLMDLRYSREDAQFLARMIKAKSVGQTQGSMGAWTRRRIVREYVAGTITRDVADTLLSRTVLAVADRAAALDDAESIATANRRRSCIKGIRRRYFTGELDVGQARAELTEQGVGLTVAGELLAGWICERKSRSKEPTVKQLTEWVTLGIITVEEFRRRLVNLGYTADDAGRIIAAADIKLRQRPKK